MAAPDSIRRRFLAALSGADPASLSVSSQSTPNYMALAERVHNGDPAAEEEFDRLFRRKVFIMMLARTRDVEAARELAQDVLLAALRALQNGQVRQVERLGAFIHGTARNIVNNYLRTRARQPQTDALPPDLAAGENDGSCETSERIELVRREVEGLDSTDRDIFLKTLVEGFKPGEIARELGLSSEFVRKRKSRAIRKVIDRIRKKMSRK